MNNKVNDSSVLLATMADGIGDLVFLSKEWIEVASEVLTQELAKRKDQLKDLESYTLCEVAVNPPPYLDCGGKLSWNAKFKTDKVDVSMGELPDSECDLKLTGDHSLMSNVARIQYHNRDPELVRHAQDRVFRLGKWVRHGKFPPNAALAEVLRSFHDTMAVRTMPRFVWMSPEWVSCARHIISSRARSDKYHAGLIDVEYKFAEEFVNPPGYAFPSGEVAGFWVHCHLGSITVGTGSLPDHLQPADFQNRGEYIPVLPVGRTVETTMTDEDREEQKNYFRSAFRVEKGMEPIFVQTWKSGKPDLPPALGRVMMVLHDELSKRTSGELPSDYQHVRDQWNSVLSFDRDKHYDSSWLKYNEYTIYGQPI